MENEKIIKDKFDEINKLALPLQKWLIKNYNPTYEIRITEGSITIYSPELHSINTIDWDNIAN